MDIVDRIKVLRSKNAGPFVFTLDIVFKAASDFEKLKRRLTTSNIAEAYKVEVKDVESFDFFDPLLAAKITIKRRKTNGHPGDPDCYAMNQEEPLAGLLRTLLN